MDDRRNPADMLSFNKSLTQTDNSIDNVVIGQNLSVH